MVSVAAFAAFVVAVGFAWVGMSDRKTFCSGDPSPVAGDVWLGGGEYVMTPSNERVVLHRPRGAPPFLLDAGSDYLIWLDPGSYRIDGGGVAYQCARLPRGWTG